MESVRGEHIAVGTEILLGQILNGHAQAISRAFAEQGMFLYRHTAVGDNLERIVDALREASHRANVVIVTGGLGPTADDLTREAMAAHLDRRLIASETAEREIEAYFAGRGRPMPEENRKQALLIEGGIHLPNPNGTAPGQYVSADGVHYFLLPGPPLEMNPMLVHHVMPKLRALFPREQVLVSRTLHFCGIGESSVDEQIPHLLSGSNPTVAPLASEGEMMLRITAAAATVDAARQQIAPIEAELRSRFSPFIYGVDGDTLPVAVGRALTARGETLAAAESCTGGLLSSMITSVPGASAYFLGGCVAYANPVKERVLGVAAQTLQSHGAVSEATAIEMAHGVRELCGSTFGIATTGIAGPDGGTTDKPVGLVYVAIAGPDERRAFRLQLRGSREQIRLRAAKQLLWRLWRAVERSPQSP
ncbi:MAG: competence/damage-inducible protein A [Alicyclobacillus sp.]|nr:competence/damage-inducible protein A [Alicyclobacillus sp.]